MKIKEMALANALGALGLIYYLGCYAIAVVAPDVYKSIAASWFHMVNLSGLWSASQGNFVLGLVSFTVVSWISGWLFAWLYNRFVK
jgi:hypothetical protein